MIEEKQFEGLKYLLSLPDGFSADKTYPLVLFLHGAGTRGDSIELLRGNTNFIKLCQHQTRGYILLAPLCSVNDWYEVMSTLIRLTETARAWNFVDSKRVHLTGNSMGGYGTWELAALRPDWFASIMPVCGGGLPGLAHTLADVPVRTFHGLQDTVVDPIESLQMAKAVNTKGGYAELILYPDLDHNCWDRVYSAAENIDWLLQFSTDRDKTMTQQYTGAYYG